jgi:serine/threonine-protein kinase
MSSQAPVADRYELKDLLGEGGMGVVYRAMDLKTKSYVALKTMRDVSDLAAVELFSKEWNVLASICHPNIVDIRDVGEIEDRGQRKPFFVMPLLPGVTLSKLIEASSPRLTVERVIGIIDQVCRGLQAAHERGLVHRDIKPSNIFVMEDDTAKIIDFGVVYLGGSHSITGQKGTLQYMAPEQVDMKGASPVTDLFSLGVVCYETLTGRKPFARKTPAETAEAIRRYIPPPILEINPSVSQLVSMVIHKAMAKQPLHRFSSARDFGDTLQKAYRNQPIERFDRAKIQPRIERAKKALAEGDSDFASEILTELESEGLIDPEIGLVRAKIDQASRQRKIRQLLEAARTRLEQDEIPLALEKLQEILEIDPDNADAHALRRSVEKQRNERQIEGWLNLARRHLDRHDFAEARQALTEVLKIRPSDAIALELLNESDRREQDALRIRTEKEQLYGSAMKAYQNGEVSTALSKLERLLDLGRQTPDAAVPDRDAIYQGFYNQVRSDRDAIHNAYEEARRHLMEQNFARTLYICDEFISRYPSDAIFQALKLEAVEQQRQELSGYIAEIGRRVDAEPDLDRKVNILKEAGERYPNEQQFQQSIKLIRDRRDLVNSIVAKARYYEEKSLFTEAIGQWDILRNIYPKYPGIEVEVSQLIERRDDQVKEEARSRLIEQIDRSLDGGDFARARELAAGALAESPQDHELAGLERLARQGLERSLEARNLCDAAQELSTAGRFEEATENLRRALELDPKSRGIREALVNALAEQARRLVEKGDWRTAEPLLQQASELDATHAPTRRLRTLITDNKRKEFVSQCLAEARDLQAAGDLEAALAKVGLGLAQYPNESRLAQLQATLQASLREVEHQKDRASDIEALRGMVPKAGQGTPVQRNAYLEQSRVISQKHPDDPEIGSLAAEVRQSASASAKNAEGDASIFSPPTVATSMSAPLQDSSEQRGTGAAAAATRGAVAQPPPAERESLVRPAPHKPWLVLARLKIMARRIWETVRHPPLPRRGLSHLQIVIVGALLLVIGVAIVVSSLHLYPRRTSTKAPASRSAVSQVTVQIQSTPPDAMVTVDGETRSGTIQLAGDRTYDVVVVRPGYRTSHQTLSAGPQWSFTLEPELLRLSFSIAEKEGKIFIDNDEKGALPSQNLDLRPDGNDHLLALRTGKREILSFAFTAKPGEKARISSLKPKDAIVVSSLGTEAVVYSGGSPGLRANLSGQEQQPIPSDGLTLSVVSADNNELAFSNNDFAKIPVEIGNAPALYVALNADTNIGYLNVQVNVPTAQLYVDEVEIKQSKLGVWRPIARKPGKYTVLAKAEGYEDTQQQVELVKDKPVKLPVELKPKVVVTTATLIVEGGTPGAVLYVDGSPVKVLDDYGSGRSDVQPGSHQIGFRKDFFESVERQVQFTRGQEAKVSDAKLKEYGTLSFKTAPPDARIRYHGADQPQPLPLRGSNSVRVPEGRYSITAEALGYQTQTKNDVRVLSGQTSPVEFKLTAIAAEKKDDDSQKHQPDSPFEKPDQLEKVNGWWKWKGANAPEYVFLRSGASRQFELSFADPGKNLFGKERKVEWVIGYVTERQKVAYDFDGKKLTRKALFGDKSENNSVACKFEKGTIQFVVSVEANLVVVRSASCDYEDSYKSPQRDLTKGKIGVKPGSEFVVN